MGGAISRERRSWRARNEGGRRGVVALDRETCVAHPIRVGVGGWTFDPWDETFYPAGLSKAKQLQHMSRTLTAVEVNGTYYSSFKPDTFAKWRDETPDGFVFSLKAHRFSTVRKAKEDMKTSTQLFLNQGITQLKDKLGPINWQFPGNRKFDREHFANFLSVLPKEKDGIELRHALEVRGAGYDDPAFFELLDKHGATVVYAEDDAFPKLDHPGSDFVVARLMQSKPNEKAGYAKKEIDRFAKMATDWSKKRDVFVFFISGAKENNPAAAVALQEKLGVKPSAEPMPVTAKKAAAKKAASPKAPAKKK
jgi:uncharacterized protein YecE (DUF72 family)